MSGLIACGVTGGLGGGGSSDAFVSFVDTIAFAFTAVPIFLAVGVAALGIFALSKSRD